MEFFKSIFGFSYNTTDTNKIKELSKNAVYNTKNSKEEIKNAINGCFSELLTRKRNDILDASKEGKSSIMFNDEEFSKCLKNIKGVKYNIIGNLYDFKVSCWESYNNTTDIHNITIFW